MPRPARMLGYFWTIRRDHSGAAPHVECGGSPPLFAVRACPDVLLAFSVPTR